MSIIHDALKKVQQNMQANKEEKIEALSPVAPAKTEEKKQPAPWLLIILSSIVIGGSLTYIAHQIHSKYPNLLSRIRLELPFKTKQVVQEIKPSTTTQSTPAFKPVETINKSIQSAKSLKPMKDINPFKYISTLKNNNAHKKPLAQMTVPQEESTNSRPLVLNVQGIMADAKKGNVALIDNEIYEEGAIIHGIKILKINIDAIVIELNGNQETVQVRK